MVDPETREMVKAARSVVRSILAQARAANQYLARLEETLDAQPGGGHSENGYSHERQVPAAGRR